MPNSPGAVKWAEPTGPGKKKKKKLGEGLSADEKCAWKENPEQQSFAAWEKILSREHKHEAENTLPAYLQSQLSFFSL